MSAIPDTALAREAASSVGRTLSEGLRQHANRTFLLARAFASARGIAFDDEGLFVATLFHDLGLADGAVHARPFTDVGADALEAFMHDRGEPIRFHMRLLPAWSKGPEAGLLQVGAWMDVMGLRSGVVGRDTVRAVEADHPRDGFDREFKDRFRATLTSPRICLRLFFPRVADRGYRTFYMIPLAPHCGAEQVSHVAGYASGLRTIIGMVMASWVASDALWKKHGWKWSGDAGRPWERARQVTQLPR